MISFRSKATGHAPRFGLKKQIWRDALVASGSEDETSSSLGENRKPRTSKSSRLPPRLRLFAAPLSQSTRSVFRFGPTHAVGPVSEATYSKKAVIECVTVCGSVAHNACLGCGSIRNARNRGEARSHSRRIRTHQKNSRTRSELHGARHLFGHVERALLVQELAAGVKKI